MGGDVKPLTGLPTSTNPIRDSLKNSQHFSEKVGGNSPVLYVLMTQIPADEESLCRSVAVYATIIIINIDLIHSFIHSFIPQP